VETSRSSDREIGGWPSASWNGELSRGRAAQALMSISTSLVTKGFEFDAVWNERRTFTVEGVEIPVARLLHIVQSKHATDVTRTGCFSRPTKRPCGNLLRREEGT
jgi:hypothetical protein